MEQRARRIATVGLLLLVATVGVGFALTGGVGVSGTVTIDAPDGPSVDVATNGGELLLDGPAGPNTVEVTHDNGGVVFESTGSTHATVDTTEIVGSYTTVSGIDASNALTITPEDKPAVTVGGGIDSVEFSSMAVDDGTRDFSYSASSSASITVNEIGAASETVIALAGDGTVLDQTTADSSGSATFSSLNSGSYNVQIATTSGPALSGATPSGGTTVSETPVELSINASDADFGTSQGDSVNVTFYDASDGTQIGSDTLTANGTATTSWSSVVGGTNEWYAVASDSYGNSVQSQTFSFQSPAKLELRNESDPDSIVTTDASAEVTFFAGEQVITRTTTDGTIDMTGLPVDETFTVQVRADGFVTRQAVIESIVDQQEVYLLPDTVDSVESRFVLDDPTGQFAPSTTRVTVKKPITRNGTTVYRTVVADILGEGGYTTVLERDQRYLLEVKDTQTGNTRTLGPYVATTSETVTLRISALQFDSVQPDIGYSWGAEYINQTDPAVKFSWGSQQNTTVEDLTVTITQKGGNKTVILDETYLNPGTFTETAVIPSTVQNPNSSTWLVEWQATIDGDTVRGSSVVGPSQLPVKLPGMSEDVMSMISVFVVLMVGGLFSTANVTVGGIITSLVAGGLWFTGALPDSISGLMIAAALFISIMAHARTNQEVSPR